MEAVEAEVEVEVAALQVQRIGASGSDDQTLRRTAILSFLRSLSSATLSQRLCNAWDILQK